ncbi:MAG: hypothetical protein J0H40_17080 [Rhizobiales bacterium]|nr:hypothetical protein [Hyphomicrobiales bacterium]
MIDLDAVNADIGLAFDDNQGAPWTDADIERLALMYFSMPRPPHSVMAERMGRTVGAMQTVISRVGMSRPGAKLRACLGVGCQGQRKFFSAGINNRICGRCERDPVMGCAA